jgi:hypothetical protein
MTTTLAHVVIANATAVPSAESVIASTPIIYGSITPVPTQNVVQPGGGTTRIKIVADINMLAGTGTTAVVIKIRQGTTTGGVQVGSSATVTLAAAANGTAHIEVEDDTGLITQAIGGQYCVTLTQTSGSANGSVNIGKLEVQTVP